MYSYVLLMMGGGTTGLF